MGWNGGGEAFDSVARRIIRLCEEKRITSEDASEVLAVLAEYLMHGDWDTYDESLDESNGHPIVLKALCTALHRVGWKPQRDDEQVHYCAEANESV